MQLQGNIFEPWYRASFDSGSRTKDISELLKFLSTCWILREPREHRFIRQRITSAIDLVGEHLRAYTITCRTWRIFSGCFRDSTYHRQLRRVIDVKNVT